MGVGETGPKSQNVDGFPRNPLGMRRRDLYFSDLSLAPIPAHKDYDCFGEHPASKLTDLIGPDGDGRICRPFKDLVLAGGRTKSCMRAQWDRSR